MTVSSEVSKSGPFSANGVTTSFPFSFKAYAASDLAVIVTDAAGVETVKTLTTHYTVAGLNDDAGGTVTFVTAPASGSSVVILRDVPLTQPTSLRNLGTAYQQTTERRFDYLTMGLQQLAEVLTRAILFPRSADAPLGTLPATRAGLFVTFDDDGNLMLSAGGVSASLPVSTFVQTLLDDANAGAFLTTLGISALVQAALDDASGAAFMATLGLNPILTPAGGRLSLTTGVPVTLGDVSAAGTVYYTPYGHDRVPIYDGASWTVAPFAELSLALDSNSGHAGYHQSGKIYDLFVFNDAGTIRLGTASAWTDDTTRAAVISRRNGVWVLGGTANLRWGSAAGNISAVAAFAATYVGTIRCTADGQTEDSAAKRFLWNTYNRRPRALVRIEGTDTWTYTTATFRQANAAAANQLAFVRGLDEDAIDAAVYAIYQNTNVGVTGSVGIGLDSTSVNSASVTRSETTTLVNQNVNPYAAYRGNPGLGYHFLAWLERSAATGTGTFIGDGGTPTLTQSGITGECWA